MYTWFDSLTMGEYLMEPFVTRTRQMFSRLNSEKIKRAKY